MLFNQPLDLALKSPFAKLLSGVSACGLVGVNQTWC